MSHSPFGKTSGNSRSGCVSFLSGRMPGGIATASGYVATSAGASGLDVMGRHPPRATPSPVLVKQASSSPATATYSTNSSPILRRPYLLLWCETRHADPSKYHTQLGDVHCARRGAERVCAVRSHQPSTKYKQQAEALQLQQSCDTLAVRNARALRKCFVRSTLLDCMIH